MALNPEDVLNKNFTATQFRKGYDEHEVDDFLDEIVVELRRLSGENDVLGKQLTACMENNGVIPPEAMDKIAAARLAAEQAEQESAARVATANAEAEQAEAIAAERTRAAEAAAEEAAVELAQATMAMPAEATDVRGSAAEQGDADATNMSSAAGVLALAEKVHEQYVSEGQQTRERLISEGQLHHDQVIGEATAKQEELESTARAKHDALIAEATARHEQMITEARERSTGMVAEAQEKRSEVLQALGQERSSLQFKIDEMKTFERDYRSRLKSHLEGQLQQLEQIGVDQAAGMEIEDPFDSSRPQVDLAKREES